MLTVQSILTSLHDWAPRALAWEKDNIGLLLGSASAEVRGVLVCLDITPAVVQEAIDEGVQVIVAHHPLIFHPLRRIDTGSTQGRMIATLLEHGIAVVAVHTNADAARYGLNRAVGLLLGLQGLRALDPATGRMLRLSLHIHGGEGEVQHAADFLRAHGELAWYSHALDGGTVVIDIELPDWQRPLVQRSLDRILDTAPHSWRTHRMDDALPQHGIGIVGEPGEEVTAAVFLQRVKEQLGCPVLRCGTGPLDRPVRRVAVCTGSGARYIGHAVSAGADVFVTGDLTHHDFLDHAEDILLVDAGHHETERVFIELCAEELENTVFEDNQKINILASRTDTNPIRFL